MSGQQLQPQVPSEPPPTYETATGSYPTAPPAPARISTDGSGADTERNGIPPERRRSMEDELRDLPPGWVRSFDPIEEHQFFVDTRAKPPRSIWVHPYDDDDYLSTLTSEARKEHFRMKRTITMDDIVAEDSDDDSHLPNVHGQPSVAVSQDHAQAKGFHRFSRKLKDKVTGTTHVEREQHRVQRAEEERRAYLAHQRARRALLCAVETGQPQFLCKDQQGRDVYIEPPRGPHAPHGAYGYNPYAQGPYADTNARFVRPAGPYGRPLGYGYGGGAGLPIAAGFLGGALLGSALF